MKKKCN